MGSKGIAQAPHRDCKSQALEEGVRDCTLAELHSAQDTVHAIQKSNQRRGSSPPLELTSTFQTHDAGVQVMCFVVIVLGKAVYLFSLLPLSKIRLSVKNT